MKNVLAAAAVADITPYMVHRTYLAGFAPDRLATGVADPLTARVIYLEDERGPMAWIGLDLIGLMLPDVDELRAKLPAFEPERILVCSTHTHSGPDTMGLWGPAVGPFPYRSGRDPRYVEWMLNQIAAAVERARALRRPARLGFAVDESDKNDWTINIRQPGYLDRAMSVMRVDDLDGGPIACLVNYACHPETLWEMNTEISPDYVHHLYRTVDEATGAVTVFFNGALGGMVTMPLDDDTPLPPRKSFYRKLGKALGKIAIQTWKKATPQDIGVIEHRTRRILTPFDNRLLYFFANLGIFARGFSRDGLETSVDFFRIGPAEFATLPGEALPVVGFAAKGLLGGSAKFLFGLANDELGYLVDDDTAADPKYHYERSVSVGPAATRLFLATLAELAAAE